MAIPDEPTVFNVPLGFVLIPPTTLASGYDRIEYQVSISLDDSIYADWEGLVDTFKATNFAYAHTGLLGNVFYKYRYRAHYPNGTFTDYSDTFSPGRGDLFNSNSVDQIAASLGTFTSGFLRGVVFETSANYPKVRMDPDGFYALSGTSTPLFIDAHTGNITLGSGTVGPGVLGAGTVGPTQLIAGSQTEQMVLNAQFQEPSIINQMPDGWSKIGEGNGNVYGYNTSAGFPNLSIDVNFNSATSKAFPVVPGEKYIVTIRAKHETGVNSVYFRLNENTTKPALDYISLGSYTRTSLTDLLSGGTIATSLTTYTYEYIAPAGVYWASLSLYNWTAGAGYLQVQYVDMRKKVPAPQINVPTLDQIAANMGIITAGIMRGVIFETNANNPKVRMDPTGFMAISTAATPILISSTDGTITSQDSAGNTNFSISGTTGNVNIAGTIFAKGGIFQNLASTPTTVSAALPTSKMKWLNAAGAETLAVYGVNQGYAGTSAVGSLIAGAQVGQGYRTRVLNTSTPISTVAYWKMHINSTTVNNELESANFLTSTSEPTSIYPLPVLASLVVGETDGCTQFYNTAFADVNSFIHSARPLDFNPPWAIDFWFAPVYDSGSGLQEEILWNSTNTIADALNGSFIVTWSSADNKIRVSYTTAAEALGTRTHTITSSSTVPIYATVYISVACTNTSVQLFINGQLEATGTPGVKSFGALALGAGLFEHAPIEQQNIVLDEIAFYRATPGKIALATPDISDHYNTGRTGLSSIGTRPVERTILDTDGGGALVPAGGMMDFGGPTAPPGWVLCDGASYDGTNPVYASLWAAIGTSWGGTGQSSFKVPDCRGRSTVGAGTGTGLTNRVFTTTAGEEVHTLSVAELAAHSHGGTGGESANHVHTAGDGIVTYRASGTGDYDMLAAAGSGKFSVASFTSFESAGHTHTIANDGSGTAHNNMQPWMAVNKIIKL